MNYHTDTTAITRTMLKTFFKSREDYYHQYILRDIPRQEPSQAMLAGQVAHAILLEGKAYSEVVAIYPEDCLTSAGSLNGRRAKAFRDENAGHVCLKAGEYIALAAMADHVARSELATLIAAASHREHVIYGTYRGRSIKCKPDFMGTLDDRFCVYDLKCTDRWDPELQRRNARRLTYWMQDAHYSYIASQHTELPVSFRFVSLELNPPYRVDWYAYDQISRERSQEKWKLIMDDLLSCEEFGEYVDEHHHTWTVDAWEMGADDEGELVDMGDIE